MAAASHDDSADDMSIFRPPILRASHHHAVAATAAAAAAASLDRARFTKTFNLAAARVHDAKNIAGCRKALLRSRELLELERVSNVRPDPDPALAARGAKCLVLRPGVVADRPATWSAVLRAAVERRELGVVPYDVVLGYDYWSYDDVIRSVLPEEVHEEIPSGFNTCGHVAHLNLRDYHLPYKHLIGEILLDKNGHIRTVINKTHDVGHESVFRTFTYEVLAGPDDMEVEVREGDCVFQFDYSKVYWNSKLQSEHLRLRNTFKPGEVVCDAMAGIGPFAVPAGKRHVFVWANDMNPESYKYLQHAIQKNKVAPFVRPFCEDGRTFIRKAADSVMAASQAGEYAEIPSKHQPRSRASGQRPEPERVPMPPTISHFVMNLPASAIEFLPSYRGLYASHEKLFSPHTETKLPLIHVYCFSLKDDTDAPLIDVCERISKQLAFDMRPGDAANDGEVSVLDVRDVAPKKRMFCASFRLPAAVAFAARE